MSLSNIKDPSKAKINDRSTPYRQNPLHQTGPNLPPRTLPGVQGGVLQAGNVHDPDAGPIGEGVAGEEDMMYLVTAMRKKIEVESSIIPVEIQLPEHVCGVMFVYDDLKAAEEAAAQTPNAGICPIEVVQA